MTNSDIPGEWSRLRQAGAAGDGGLGLASIELETRAPAGRLRLAVSAVGELLLLAPVSTVPSPGGLPTADGLSVQDVTLRLDGRPQRYIQLACGDRALEGVFADVVVQVVRRIADGAAPLEAMESTIDDYRTLLRKAREPSVGQDRLVGLIGELRVLVRLLLLNPEAWRAWAPLAGRHDFRAGPVALECKTTLRAAGRRVSISSLEQLEAPEAGGLHLRLQVLEPDMGGDLTLHDLGRRALSLAAGSPDLEALLRDCGWSPDASVSPTRFSLLSEETYEVRDGFPRLTAASLVDRRLPAGVGPVTYALDLAAASAFLVSEPDAHLHEERLADAPAPLR